MISKSTNKSSFEALDIRKLNILSRKQFVNEKQRKTVLLLSYL